MLGSYFKNNDCFLSGCKSHALTIENLEHTKSVKKLEVIDNLTTSNIVMCFRPDFQ